MLLQRKGIGGPFHVSSGVELLRSLGHPDTQYMFLGASGGRWFAVAFSNWPLSVAVLSLIQSPWKGGRHQMWLLNPPFGQLDRAIIAHSSCSPLSTYLYFYLCLCFWFSLFILSTLYQSIEALASNKVFWIKNAAAPPWSLKCLWTGCKCKSSLVVQG